MLILYTKLRSVWRGSLARLLLLLIISVVVIIVAERSGSWVSLLILIPRRDQRRGYSQVEIYLFI